MPAASARTATAVRVAVDIGGTFTDLHLHDPASGRTVVWKTPSTPADPSIGLLNGLRGVSERAGVAPADIGLILHGSTIATNAVLERKLPRGALITTDGFRDVLEIGRHIRRDVYTLRAEPRALLVPRQRRFGVPERIAADGRVERPLDEAALRAVVERLLRHDVETVAVAFLHGYRNPTHERRAAALIGELAPRLAVTTSHETSPEIREFERTSTTVLNALLRPVISGYLQRIDRRLRDAGVSAKLYLVQSNGGLATPQDAARLPVKLLLSGPAGGAMAMATLARRRGLGDLVGFDMGGTSSDISVVRDGHITETAESTIDGLPVRTPMIEIRTVGAGGGSIARLQRLDAAAALRVGPGSAGAEPGPVCYRRGGEEPTVTDANAALGRLDARSFRTGGLRLDADAAAAALRQRIAEPLGLNVAAAAAGVLDVATATMAGAIRLSLFEKGADPADFALAPFGGAAGLHACAVAHQLGVPRIVFPADASTLSALGILRADLRYDLSESQLLPAVAESLPALARAVDALRRRAAALLTDAGVDDARRRVEFSGDLRYRGQAFELATPWPALDAGGAPDLTALTTLVEDFHRYHERRFAHSAPADAVEIVTVRAVARGLLHRPADARRATAANADMDADMDADMNADMDADTNANANANTTSRDASTPAPAAERQVYLHGAMRTLPCYRRDALIAAAATIVGPALIEEDYTVLLIETGWTLRALRDGDLLCERQCGEP